jgi:hypothetical protein
MVLSPADSMNSDVIYAVRATPTPYGKFKQSGVHYICYLSEEYKADESLRKCKKLNKDDNWQFVIEKISNAQTKLSPEIKLTINKDKFIDSFLYR